MTVQHSICLNGKKVNYLLKRRNRKSIGLKIDSNGLVVSIPIGTSKHSCESLLQDKADWIIRSLDHWASKKTTRLTWAVDAKYPLLGKPWRLTVSESGMLAMKPDNEEALLPKSKQVLSLLTAEQIEKYVMAWYAKEAMLCFSERILWFANKLAVPCPQLRLSKARTLWGSCHSRGVIHLNWRLIQMPLNLVDYVVAHEISHLIEMNHSPAFWRLVAGIYPDYLAARDELKAYG